MRSKTSALGVKKIIYSIIVMIFLTSCGQQVVNNTSNESVETNNNATKTEKISVTSSIIPLSSVINTVGGDFVEVNNVIPAGVSPHGFDMSAQNMAALERSEIVFLTGLDHIDGFLKKAATNKTQIHVADGMQLLESTGHDHHDDHEDSHDDDDYHDDHESHEEHEDDHHNEHEDEKNDDEHGHDKDPHVWLGKDNIITIANIVRDELSKILPDQADYFAANSEAFASELEEIFNEFSEQTAGKTAQEFIVFHDAYNYLFESIGLDTNLKIVFSENVLHELGTAHMAELIEEIELHSITNIFKEPQFSDTNLQKFSDEYNLTIGTLDPIGVDEGANGYMTHLKNNLDSLSAIYE